MDVKIQLSDAVYASLINSNKRIRGSIRLVSPTEGNFNEHQQQKAKPSGHSMKLPHGKVTVDEKKVRMHLYIARTEQVNAARVIEAESVMACDYVDFMEDMA